MKPLRQVAAEAYTAAFRRMVNGEKVDVWQEVADAICAAVIDGQMGSESFTPPKSGFDFIG